MRKALLRWLHTCFPFDLLGDCVVPDVEEGIRISCVINFYGRLDVLCGVLFSLQEQTYPRNCFEVVLIEDQGGSEAGRKLAETFAEQLPIRYLPLDAHYGMMGYSRNFGVANSRGEILLFLDDDTVLLQPDFLSELDRLLQKNPRTDAVIPHGHAAFSLIADHYAYHDPFFMTSRCTAYRRQVLRELGGFMNHFVGQEDVEFVVRFTLAGKSAMRAHTLHYFHPPLLVPNTRKPRAVGYSLYGLKERYSWPIWLLLLINCSRHALLSMVPSRRYREQGRFGRGVLLGIIDGIRGKKGQVYG